MEQNKTIIVVAGEASGDMHASHLVDQIKSLDPQIKFYGLGGTAMKHSGVELYADLTRIAVVGFVEVLKHYGEFKRVFDLVLEKIKETKADAVILVDYPGFNLRLARAIKKQKLPTKVIYYISPQVWAWKESRVKLIKAVVDRMLVILPFEKGFYQKWDYEVDFVGHPLMETMSVKKNPSEFLTSQGLSDKKYTIGLLPGSREKEIEKILPIMLESARILGQKNPNMQFLLVKAPTVSERHLRKYSNDISFPLRIVSTDTYSAIHSCGFCMVTSGTATLETAILEKPMVILYKTSFLTWAMAKWLVKIDQIGLVNVIAGKKIVPEFIQYDADPTLIAHEIQSIITDEIRIAEIKMELRKVKSLLGEAGASRRAAEITLEVISPKPTS